MTMFGTLRTEAMSTPYSGLEFPELVYHKFVKLRISLEVTQFVVHWGSGEELRAEQGTGRPAAPHSPLLGTEPERILGRAPTRQIAVEEFEPLGRRGGAVAIVSSSVSS